MRDKGLTSALHLQCRVVKVQQALCAGPQQVALLVNNQHHAVAGDVDNLKKVASGERSHPHTD